MIKKDEVVESKEGKELQKSTRELGELRKRKTEVEKKLESLNYSVKTKAKKK
ncbi:hypothetical protein [endosymbiont GvMRE of Glomus versiforme]|uniref:hypothetical protein n=1 Tax=endosymbiont GvMRE of Glomus versiforme TaxID=2039283 RepID=UPI000EC60572|nr:hypothetical protein [endosymbiont GvMRE of Glomus versiforme]RHZ35267.1 hypothetical protein GvMRE_IIg469 [endosymbiont GvMRE of Glomus versiforme]